jgi:acetolactate synthase-1/2/3 large subunit
MNVSEFITNFFISRKIMHVFGFQGGAILKLLDSMISSGCIEYIQNYHEQASSFCADAYARISGNVGVAMATSGPGATNLINGIANAQFDSIPCIFITGQDYTYNIDKPEGVRQNGFQDLDIVSMVKPITKYAVTITDPNRIRYELEKAFYLATSGRPGAVLLDIPIDIQFASINENNLNGFIPEEESYEIDKVHEVISRLKQAGRPVILAGGGVRIAKAVGELKEFADFSGIPVVATLNGIDAYDKTFSFSGLHGNTFSNLTVYNADLLIVLGARLGLRQVGKYKNNYSKAKIIHVDIDKNELNRVLLEDLSIYADLKLFLAALNQALKQEVLPDFREWYATVEKWEKNYSQNTFLNEDGIDPVRFIRELSRLFADDAIITADVGQNQMWVAQALKIKKSQRLLNSSGFGSMGYSLPAAIGAKTANPEAQVIAFTGDGGLQMNVQELLLLSRRRLDIKCIVFNNNTLGMMREVQRRYFDSKYYGSREQYFVCVNLELLAQTYGIGYLRVPTEGDLSKIEQVLNTNGPYLIDLQISSESKLLNRYDEAEVFENEAIND